MKMRKLAELTSSDKRKDWEAFEVVDFGEPGVLFGLILERDVASDKLTRRDC